MSKSAVASSSFIESLRVTLPPARLFHVGVGAGVGMMHVWRNWPLEVAWLIDASPASLQWLEPLAVDHPQWQIRIATLAASAGTANFYHASNPAESGLIAPSTLRGLWPNLQEISSEEHQTLTLDSLVDSNTDFNANLHANGDWLLVDCMTSLAVLRGAEKILQQCSVVWLRTLLTPLPVAENSDECCTLAQLQSLLEPLGFSCAHISECNHPALAEVIFLRNWRSNMQTACSKLAQENAAQVSTLEQEKITLMQQHRIVEKEITKLTEERDERAWLAQERQKRILQLTQAMADQAAQLQQNKDQLSELLKEPKQKTQELADGQENSSLLSKQSNEHQAQLQHAQTQLGELQTKLQAQEQKNKLREAHMTEIQAKLQQREADITLLTRRQQQITEELVRAEAQIDLITNVLLREQGI